MHVSVIIPTHDYAHYVVEAIDSVLAQTVADREILEVIVVDDASTDDTPRVLEAIDDPRVRVIRFEESRGVSVARNTALREVRGEFVAYHDADDRWRPDKLERQLEVLRSDPDVGLVFTDMIRFNEKGVFPLTHFETVPELREVPSRPSASGGARVIEGDTFLHMTGLPLLGPLPPTAVLRADIARAARWPEGVHHCTDLYYFLQVYRLTRIAYLDEPLVEVRRHGNNSYGSALETQHHFLNVLDIVEGEPLSPEHHDAIRRAIGRKWTGVGYYHFWNRSPLLAGRAYVRALRYPGSRWNAAKHLALLPLVPLLPARTRQGPAFDDPFPSADPNAA